MSEKETGEKHNKEKKNETKDMQGQERRRTA